MPGWPAAGAASAQANGLGYLCGRTYAPPPFSHTHTHITLTHTQAPRSCTLPTPPPPSRRVTGLAASYATGSSSASRSDERQSNGSNDGASGEYHDAAGFHSDAAMVLHLDLDEFAEEAADSMREKLQLTAEEWNEWEELKEGCLTTMASVAASWHAPTRPASLLHPGMPQLVLPLWQAG